MVGFGPPSILERIQTDAEFACPASQAGDRVCPILFCKCSGEEFAQAPRQVQSSHQQRARVRIEFDPRSRLRVKCPGHTRMKFFARSQTSRKSLEKTRRPRLVSGDSRSIRKPRIASVFPVWFARAA